MASYSEVITDERGGQCEVLVAKGEKREMWRQCAVSNITRGAMWPKPDS